MKAKERHDIKTDRFLETVAVAQDFLSRHGRTILFTVGAILLVAVSWLGISWYLESRETAAAAALNEALAGLLDARMDNADDAAALDEVADKLQSVAENHGGTAAAIIARFNLGMVKAACEDYDAAETEYRAVIDSRHPFYWELAAAELGRVYERRGEHERACEIYRLVADSDNPGLPVAYFAFKAGNCYEELDDAQEALRYYNLAKSSDTLMIDSTLSMEIERRLQELGGSESEAEVGEATSE